MPVFLNINVKLLSAVGPHYAHTYTVKLYSDMLRWRPPPSAGITTPQIKKQHYLKVSILSCTHCYLLGPPSTQSHLCHSSHVRSYKYVHQ